MRRIAMQRCVLACGAFALALARPGLAEEAARRIELRCREATSEHEARLAEELRLYTKDLGAEVVLRPWTDAPAAEGTTVVVWIEASSGAPVVEAVRAADGAQREIALPSAVAYTAAALKIRALVATQPVLAPPAAATETPAPPVDPPPTPPAPEPESKPPPPVVAAPVVDAPAPVIDAPAPGFQPIRIELLGGATLGLVHATLGAEASARAVWWWGAIGVALDASLPTRDERSWPGAFAHLADVPAGVEGLWRKEFRAFELSAGGGARLHLIDAAVVSNDGRGGKSVRPSVGLGPLVGLRRSLSAHWGIVALARAEVVVPQWQFTYDGRSGPSSSLLRCAFDVGLSWSGP